MGSQHCTFGMGEKVVCTMMMWASASTLYSCLLHKPFLQPRTREKDPLNSSKGNHSLPKPCCFGVDPLQRPVSLLLHTWHCREWEKQHSVIHVHTLEGNMQIIIICIPLSILSSMAIGSVRKEERVGYLLVSTALKRYSLSFFSLTYVSIRRLYISE